jgi:hypothetical protein
MMHATMVVGHGIDRRVALDQDEASAGRIEEDHLSVRGSRQMLAPDDLGIELRALRGIAHGNAEMSDSSNCNHVILPLMSRLNGTSYPLLGLDAFQEAVRQRYPTLTNFLVNYQSSAR